MKKVIICTWLIAGLAINQSIAQENIDPINTGAANFLTITPDARMAGMAGAGLTITGNNNAVFYNAAASLLDDERNGGATYTYTPWLRGFESGHSLHSLGGFYKIDQRNAILAGFRYYNYPKLNVINNGAVVHNFRPNELALDIAYAREVTSNLGISATIRYIRSDMGNIGGTKTANAVAFDIGAIYRGSFSGISESSWNTGLNLTNIGSKLKYLDTKESLPAMAKLGGSVDLPFSQAHRLIVATDLGYRIAPSDVKAFSAAVGAEYAAIELLSLRGGYHYGEKNKGDTSYATAGIGLRYTGVHLDFSWLFAESSSPLNNTFRISLGYSF